MTLLDIFKFMFYLQKLNFIDRKLNLLSFCILQEVKTTKRKKLKLTWFFKLLYVTFITFNVVYN